LRSRSTTSVAPRSARWYAIDVPITPPPTTTYFSRLARCPEAAGEGGSGGGAAGLMGVKSSDMRAPSHGLNGCSIVRPTAWPPVRVWGRVGVVTPSPPHDYVTQPLTPETWPDFAALVEANNGVWGGCWCMGFHAEGLGKDSTADGNREAKRTQVTNGTVHQMLVYHDGECVGWIQYGSPAEVATIKNPKAYEKDLVELPDWRIGCVFTGSKHRGKGGARDGLAGAV